MQMNRAVIARYVSKKAYVRHLLSGTPVANVRVGESVRHADGSGKHGNLRTGTASVFTESLPMSPRRSRRATTYTSMAGSSNDSSSRATATSRGRCTRLL